MPRKSMLQSELIVDLDSLERLVPEWDALAVSNTLPLMSPAWIMAWWAHLAPAAAQPRVVAVREHGELVGLAPFFFQPDARIWRIDYRLPGISAGVAPLAMPGRELRVAKAIGSELAHADPFPDVILLEGVPLASAWHLALR